MNLSTFYNNQESVKQTYIPMWIINNDNLKIVGNLTSHVHNVFRLFNVSYIMNFICFYLFIMNKLSKKYYSTIDKNVNYTVTNNSYHFPYTCPIFF